MHVYIAKCNGCNASFPPYPIDDGAGGSVCPVFSLPCFVGIFFHSSSRLYTLPLFWSFLAQMEAVLHLKALSLPGGLSFQPNLPSCETDITFSRSRALWRRYYCNAAPTVASFCP